MVLAAAVCRIRPGLGVILIGSLALLHVAVDIPVVLGDALTFYAMFCAISYGTPAVHAAGIGAGFLGVLVQAGYWAVSALRDVYGTPVQALITFVGLVIVGSITITAIWALANLQRARVRQLVLTRERAEQAVREREQRTALAVAEERSRIAREMHDVVAHSLSVIIAQADGGRFIASQQPEKATDVLSTIGETDARPWPICVLCWECCARTIRPPSGRSPVRNGSTSWPTGCAARGWPSPSSATRSWPTCPRPWACPCSAWCRRP